MSFHLRLLFDATNCHPQEHECALAPGWRVARSIQGSAPSQAMRPLLQQPCSLHGYGAYRSWGRAESGNLRRVAAVRSSDGGRLGVRDFARSKHSSRRLVLPIYRPTTVNITPRRYPESPGSSRTAHGAAHGASRRTAPTMLMADLDRKIRFPPA